MPYSAGDLRREVHILISTKLEAGHEIIRGWITHEILSRHPLPIIRDREFNVMCRQEQVARAVRDVLRDLKLADKDPAAVSSTGLLPFPGYKHLQLGYPFTNDEGELIIIPLVLMTRHQKYDRAASYDRMAVGCREHAQELRRHARTPPPAMLEGA